MKNLLNFKQKTGRLSAACFMMLIMMLLCNYNFANNAVSGIAKD